MELKKHDRTWVHDGGRKIEATVDVVQPRHLILRLDNGAHAKVLRTSDRVAVVRNRMTFRFLSRECHPGLLRVFARVTGASGKHGYACETLTPHPMMVGMDPHPLTASLRLLLKSGVILGGALGIMHASRRIHGDTTPHNVLMRGDTPVLIDFETSVLLGQFSSYRPNDHSDNSVFATSGCCSPEQATRKRVTAASDVYCLALTMLSWATGEYGVTKNCGDGNSFDAMWRCARAQYPYWGKAEERIRAKKAIDLFKGCIQESSDREPADGNAFAVRCQHLLDTLPKKVLDRPVIERGPPEFPAGSPGFVRTSATSLA